jgi:hypothetical protein
LFHISLPGTAVPGFPMPPLRGWIPNADHATCCTL